MSRKPVGLQQRLITALVLLALLVALVFLAPPWATIAVIALAMLGGAWEWSAFLHHDRRRVRAAYVALVALGLVAAWSVSTTIDSLSMLLLAACAWWVIALLWIMLAPQRGGAISAAIAGLCALVPAGVALARVRLDLAPVTLEPHADPDAARALAAIIEERGDATVTRTRCEDIQVGGFGLPRYRCTVWYTVTPPAPAADTRQPAAPMPAPTPAP